jgi:hypothetical protein
LCNLNYSCVPTPNFSTLQVLLVPLVTPLVLVPFVLSVGLLAVAVLTQVLSVDLLDAQQEAFQEAYAAVPPQPQASAREEAPALEDATAAEPREGTSSVVPQKMIASNIWFEATTLQAMADEAQ